MSRMAFRRTSAMTARSAGRLACTSEMTATRASKSDAAAPGAFSVVQSLSGTSRLLTVITRCRLNDQVGHALAHRGPVLSAHSFGLLSPFFLVAPAIDGQAKRS